MDTPTTIKYAVRHVNGEANSAHIASALVNRSIYFAVTPLPDDWYEFVVKECDTHVFTQTANALAEYHQAGLIVKYPIKLTRRK
jgi:hypothetical protein